MGKADVDFPSPLEIATALHQIYPRNTSGAEADLSDDGRLPSGFDNPLADQLPVFDSELEGAAAPVSRALTSFEAEQ